MNSIRLAFFSTILCFAYMACHENEESITETDVTDPPKVTISTTHTARIINEYGQEKTAFTATFNQQQWKAEKNGVMVFEAKKINKYGEKMTIKDDKGFDQAFLLSGHENDINYSVLTIFDNKKTKTFAHDNTTTLDVSPEIALAPNTFKINNSTYIGQVQTTTFAPDINDAFQATAIPQVRVGQDANGRRVFLNISKSYFLKINTVFGENLTANINILNPKNVFTSDNLKLWYCDMDAAVWREVTVNKETDVFHYPHTKDGFYCLAVASPGIYVSGKTLLDGKPVSNLTLKIASHNQYIHTSAAGNWSVFLPTNATTALEISASCGMITKANIVTQNTDIQNFIIDLNKAKSAFSLLKGKVKDCLGNNAGSYILKNANAGDGYIFGKDAAIEQWIATCDLKEIVLKASDIYGNETGNPIVWPVSPVIESGSWFACTEAKNPYINLIIDGENKMYWDMSTSKNTDGRMKIQITKPGSSEALLNLIAPADGTGIKMDNQLNILLRENEFEGKGYEIYCPTSTLGCGFERFEITHFNYQNDKIIRGYFKGKFWTKSYNPLTAGYKNVEGEFQVLKAF